MKAPALLIELRREARDRTYVERLDIIEQTQSLVKARLHITSDLFLQVYRNDRFDTTNFAVINNQRRIYARDQLGGGWHRHTVDAPDGHDTTEEGCRPVDLSEFLDDAEAVLSVLGLP